MCVLRAVSLVFGLFGFQGVGSHPRFVSKRTDPRPSGGSLTSNRATTSRTSSRRISCTPQRLAPLLLRASTPTTGAGQVHSPRTTCRTYLLRACSASNMGGGSNECQCTSDEHGGLGESRRVPSARVTSARDCTPTFESIEVVSDLASAIPLVVPLHYCTRHRLCRLITCFCFVQ